MHRSSVIVLLCEIVMAITRIVEYFSAVVSLLEKYPITWLVKSKRELHSCAQMMHRTSLFSGRVG
jgi:hypothetical protein